jgi:hypothetical protein
MSQEILQRIVPSSYTVRFRLPAQKAWQVRKMVEHIPLATNVMTREETLSDGSGLFRFGPVSDGRRGYLNIPSHEIAQALAESPLPAARSVIVELNGTNDAAAAGYEAGRLLTGLAKLWPDCTVEPTENEAFSLGHREVYVPFGAIYHDEAIDFSATFHQARWQYRILANAPTLEQISFAFSLANRKDRNRAEAAALLDEGIKGFVEQLKSSPLELRLGRHCMSLALTMPEVAPSPSIFLQLKMNENGRLLDR